MPTSKIGKQSGDVVSKLKGGQTFIAMTPGALHALDKKIASVFAKKKLQVVAKPSNVDKFSKEATAANMTIVTKEEFFAQAANAPVSLESGADLEVGQPVVGSDKGSIYFVVAKLDGLQVAMRWKGALLSVRIAGPKLADYVDRLTAPGIFANHSDKGYFSAHLGQAGAIEELAGAVSAQMLYASVLAAVAQDVDNFVARAPYGWRNWQVAKLVPGAAPY